MHILYVDESGTPDPDPDSRHFVVAALALPLRNWKARDFQLRQILAAHRLLGVELHTAWMARRYPEQGRIPDFDRLSDQERRRRVELERRQDLGKAALRGDRAVKGLRKNYQKTSDYVHLTHSERVGVLQAVADAVAGWSEGRLFGDSQQKDSLTFPASSCRANALEQVTTRFNTYLKRQQNADSMGILVHDQHQAESLKLTRIFRDWHDTGTAFTSIPFIAETPLFVDSSLTLMIQVADLVSYAIRRFCDRGEVDLFDRVYPRFERDRNGKLVGLRHYTGKKSCSCKICIDHGRI